MKPPDYKRCGSVWRYLLIYLVAGLYLRHGAVVSATEAVISQGPSNETLLVPFTFLDRNNRQQSKNRNNIVNENVGNPGLQKSLPKLSIESSVPPTDDVEFVTLTSVRANSREITENETNTEVSVSSDPEGEGFVTKTSVQGTIVELGASQEEERKSEFGNEDVTKTSLRITGAEVGENGEVVSAFPSAELSDFSTQTSVKFTQTELEENTESPVETKPIQEEPPKAFDVQRDLKLDDIIKKIESEDGGEARILFVSDTKGKKGKLSACLSIC